MGLFDIENGSVNVATVVAPASEESAAPTKKMSEWTKNKNVLAAWLAANQSLLPTDILAAAKACFPTAFGVTRSGGAGGIAPTYFTSTQRKALELFGGDKTNEVPEVFDTLVGKTITEDEVFAKLKIGRGEMRGLIRDLAKTPKNIGRAVVVQFDPTTGVYTLAAVTPVAAGAGN